MNNGHEKGINDKSVLRAIDKITNLPTIPHILFQVNEMLQDGDVSIKKMGDVIETDQVLASRILILVNSAFYGFQSKIIDVRQAVMILGFNTVRNALATVSVIDLFRANEKYKGFEILDLWKHSIAVAATGKYLAEKGRLASPADCFIAGLLHDIGKLIIAENFTNDFSRILKLASEENISFIDAENKISSYNHALIGGHFAQKWKLPGRLVEAIMYHHIVNKNAADFWLQVSTYAANIIVKHNYMESGYEKLLISCPELSEILTRLGPLSEWRSVLNAEIVQLTCLFEGDCL